MLLGTVCLGYGDEFDESKGHAFRAGNYFVIPAGANHFIRAKDAETIVQELGYGPTGMTRAIPKR